MAFYWPLPSHKAQGYPNIIQVMDMDDFGYAGMTYISVDASALRFGSMPMSLNHQFDLAVVFELGSPPSLPLTQLNALMPKRTYFSKSFAEMALTPFAYGHPLGCCNGSIGLRLT